MAVGCAQPLTTPKTPTVSADIVIVGGGTGGVAAAIAACRAGVPKVILTEETDWIGGQLTAQITPPDEHKWIETTGATQTYRNFRNEIRKVYKTRKAKPLKPLFQKQANLNPGNGWVSRICHEPRVGLAVLEKMLEPFILTGQLSIMRHYVVVGATTESDTVKRIHVIENRSGSEIALVAKYFLDATDEGDLIPHVLRDDEYVTGSESKADTGEPNGSNIARPGNIQSFTWPFIIEYRDGEEHVIEKPREYDFWKLRLGFDDPRFVFFPKGERDSAKPDAKNFWTYRRIIDANRFTGYHGDVSVINIPQNDYTLGSLHGSSKDDAAKHRERSKQMSLSLLYWLQTACPRSDGKAGWPGLRLCPEQTGTDDGLAMAPYIRESRRIRALFTVKEQHVSQSLREKEGLKQAERFADTCGIGYYMYMDLHQTCEGEKKGGWPVFPFQIPVGSLIPNRVTNLLAACKNLGVTHLTNGCYRLHPVEWNIGEAAGALAAFSIKHSIPPIAVREKHMSEFQKLLTAQGLLLEWPETVAQ